MAADEKTKTTQTSNIVVKIEKEIPETFSSAIEKIVKDAQYRDRTTDKILKNETSSVTVRKDGVIAASSGNLSHLQLMPNGISARTASYEGAKSNVHSIDAEDIIINSHKLNNKLYELADFKQVLNGYDKTPTIAGGLTMFGTVLVKAWEPNLQRYVLVRRQINMPMFSPNVGSYDVVPGLNITPNINAIQEIVNQINMAGITTYAQLATELQEQRKQAILKQEETTAANNKSIIDANKQKQATSMTTITGQDPSAYGSSFTGGATQNYNVSPQNIADKAKLAGDQEKEQEDTDHRSGWDDANGRPVSTTAYWYKVQCKAHKFNVMQGHTVLKTYPCNTSHKGTTTQKVSGDNKTLLGVFQITKVEKNNLEADKRSNGCKLPNTAGTFGTYWLELSCGFGIGIHGDYPSEDAKKILTKDAPADREPQPGEGSTHGCVRLYNNDVEEVATKYAKMQTGQYVKIEE